VERSTRNLAASACREKLNASTIVAQTQNSSTSIWSPACKSCICSAVHTYPTATHLILTLTYCRMPLNAQIVLTRLSKFITFQNLIRNPPNRRPSEKAHPQSYPTSAINFRRERYLPQKQDSQAVAMGNSVRDGQECDTTLWLPHDL
jgi:hypothetical protein